MPRKFHCKVLIEAIEVDLPSTLIKIKNRLFSMGSSFHLIKEKDLVDKLLPDAAANTERFSERIRTTFEAVPHEESPPTIDQLPARLRCSISKL